MATEADVRRIALALPETTEETWYGIPGFKVTGKGFLRLRTDAEGALVIFVSHLGEQQALVAGNSEAFFITPHYANYPAVLVNLKAVAVDELTELITESWRLKAPQRVLKAFDEAANG